MIEKMKFLSITGPKADIDRVVCTYLSRYEIHLENALSELKTVKDLRPYIESNQMCIRDRICTGSRSPLPLKTGNYGNQNQTWPLYLNNGTGAR